MSRTQWCALLFLVWWTAAAADTELKDPMRPVRTGAVGSAAAGQAFHLTATLVSRVRRIAIVNGRPARVGDAVDGAQVVAIRSSSVDLRMGARTFTVALGKGPALQDEQP